MMVGGVGAPRVLIVDDDEAIRELLRDILGAEGYEVDEAINGAEAVERARSNPPAAVLMDLMMPVVSGIEATTTLKNDPQTARIPILGDERGSQHQHHGRRSCPRTDSSPNHSILPP